MNSYGHERSIHVAVVGVGGVGKELVNQLIQSPYPFSLAALCNSKRMVLYTDGTKCFQQGSSDSPWWVVLADETVTVDACLDTLRDALRSLAQAGKKVVLVDNTSDLGVAKCYPSFLNEGIHVVTPNKKAFSGDLGDYKELVRSAGGEALGRGKVYNESTVGAGLPIVQTLKDLVNTGDKILKIEGVFSGTMSYIFNEFSKEGAGSFSKVVEEAKNNGYTEPNPGDDLNGADVARKLAILSRMIPALSESLPRGYEDVQTQSLVPDVSKDVGATEFMSNLFTMDDEFGQKRKEAAQRGNVLRYVGVIDVKNGVIKAELAEYPNSHAFATSLQDADNIIMFHTERYKKRPLLIQGPGAGNEVTAMGVMSDLLKLI
ncbi:homoserine dehydrogenase-domain-containing protein [Phlebopus sp. FC_14]|nr:homoserine dehydrogenase-domain-containing protein [Phlebopus sp. FC_14]